MSNEVRITTEDNPYNPFFEFEEWLGYDTRMGYCTCERLAELSSVQTALTDEENNYFVNLAVEKLLEIGAINKKGEFVKYKKVQNN